LGPFYSIRKNNLVFFGEASLNEKLTSAFLTGVIISASQKLSIGILYRRYPENFHDLKSEAFGTNTDNANETGTWIGINYKIKNSIVYSAYSDVCKFPFLKYKVDRPSYSTDFMQQVDFTPNRKTVFQLRYRNRMKQGNSLNPSDKLNSLVDNSTTSIRVSARFKFEDGWEYGVRCETSIQKSENNPALKGTLISQDIFFKPMGKSYSFNFRYSVFSCPDFDSRIYSYENDVSGAFSVPFYYGIGSKFYINFSKGISRRISLATKYTISRIKDANGKINQPSEIKIQMKFSFS
jgi:hypothetical protein